MSFQVIDNPNFYKFKENAGFKNHEFKQLAALFSRGASHKVFYDMGVDVDFEDAVCTFVYYRSNSYIPHLQFIIRQVGPRTTMYEVWKDGKGRIAKSGLFSRAYDKLNIELEKLIEDQT